jgi:sugar fermentation stimulation protein A
MIIKGPLISGTFIERPNRFITLVNINGKIVRSHLPDPGRLKELLIPGVELLLSKFDAGLKRSSTPGINSSFNRPGSGR